MRILTALIGSAIERLDDRAQRRGDGERVAIVLLGVMLDRYGPRRVIVWSLVLSTPFLLAAKSADVPLMKVLLESGAAYRCWCTPDELDAVRREQEAKKEPPRYNRR